MAGNRPIMRPLWTADDRRPRIPYALPSPASTPAVGAFVLRTNLVFMRAASTPCTCRPPPSQPSEGSVDTNPDTNPRADTNEETAVAP
jgi:hypothetical protein